MTNYKPNVFIDTKSIRRISIKTNDLFITEQKMYSQIWNADNENLKRCTNDLDLKHYNLQARKVLVTFLFRIQA